jgi:uncharacterized repeat protein (TIGR03803 family)
MKSSMKNPFIASVLIAVLTCVLPRQAAADTLTTLHSFTAPQHNTNADGDYPQSGLIVSGNTLYGTASYGGSSAAGTVFAVGTDGSDYTVLHTFSSNTNYGGSNSDGAFPVGGLLLSGNTLYGTTDAGGKSGSGTVFALDIIDMNLTTLYNFTNGDDGGIPVAGLLLAGGTLYGTASFGGSEGWGTVFSLGTNGKDFSVLYSFTNGSDGGTPSAALVLSGSNVYSTTAQAGTANNGTVFCVSTNGTGFTVLHAFTPFLTNSAHLTYNSDGAFPFAGLTLSGDVLYGAASQGGTAGVGTVFSINTDGTGFTTLHSFTKLKLIFNDDGVLPVGTLILSGNTLYGTARLGGAHDGGTVFSVSISGADFTTLCSLGTLGKGADGSWPEAGVVLSGNDLYGTTYFGGKANFGTVFSLSKGPVQAPPPNSAMLTVQVGAPGGSVIPNDNGKSIPVGKTIQLQAVPAHDYLFSNWVATGGSEPFVSNNPVLKFAMQSGLVLQANFVTNIFLPVLGKFSGLFEPTNGTPRAQGNSGSFLLTLTRSGACSGTLDLGGQSVPFSGAFDLFGEANIVSKTVHGIPSLTIILQLDFTNQSLSGAVSNGNFFAGLTGYREAFNSSDKATSFAGQYTLVIPGTTNPAVGPFGDSYGTVKVDDLGNITLGGSLADGIPISQSSVVSQDGYWPFYVDLYGGNGSLWGWNYFTNHTLRNAYPLSWINATNPSKTAVYRSGFTNPAATLTGGLYLPSQSLPTDLTATLEGGGLPSWITNGVTISASDKIALTNKLDETNKLTLKITKSTGVISGSFANPSGATKPIKVSGVILQQAGQANAQGYFLGTNQSGAFNLGPP